MGDKLKVIVKDACKETKTIDFLIFKEGLDGNIKQKSKV